MPEGELVFTAEPWEVEQVVKVGTPDVTLQVKRMAAVRRQEPVVGAKVSAARRPFSPVLRERSRAPARARRTCSRRSLCGCRA